MKILVTLFSIIVFPSAVFSQYVQWAAYPKYDAIAPFKDGVAVVKLNGKYGYINHNGVEIIKPEYDFAYDFNDGAGVITQSDKTAVVAIADASGKLSKPKEQLKVDNRFAGFSDGLLLVSNGKKWGYLNQSGALSIACKYFSAQPFSEGYAAVRLDDYWYYINAHGQTVIPPDKKKVVYWAMGFDNGLAPVLFRDGMKYIDIKGKEQNRDLPQITPPEEYQSYFQSTLPCKEGNLVFDNKCRAIAFIDKDNKTTELLPVFKKTLSSLRDGHFIYNGKAIPFNSDQLDWQNSSVAVMNFPGSGYGMIALANQPPIQLSIAADTLESVFGNPVRLNLSLKNGSSTSLNNLACKCNGKNLEAISLEPNQSKNLETGLSKESELPRENKDVAVLVEDKGLLLGEWKQKVTVKDIPSIGISIPKPELTIYPNETPVFIVKIENNARNEEAKDIKISINGYSAELFSLRPNESKEIRMSVTPGTKVMTVSAKQK